MRWDAFAESCPRIAELAEERFRAEQVVILGTIRPDGSPRLSPCEVDFATGRLLLGVMWQSRKATDLLQDPRIAVLSVPPDRTAATGDVKLYGRVVDERRPEVRTAYRDEIKRRIDWAPDEPNYHLFSVDVERAAFIRFGERRLALAWDATRGFREVRHPDATD